MPTLSMFFGIIIRMYYAPKEHGPAHIHAIYMTARPYSVFPTVAFQKANFRLSRLGLCRPG
jgi:hypothetical protein